MDRCCATASEVAALVEARPGLRLWGPPELSTVVFRPELADDDTVAAIRRALLTSGDAVIGRARLPEPDGTRRLWLKLTLLNPEATADDYRALVARVAATEQSPVAS